MTDTAHDYARRIADELREIAHVDEQWRDEWPRDWDPIARHWANDHSFHPELEDDRAYDAAPDIGMGWLGEQLDVWANVEWRHPQWEQPRTTVNAVTVLRTCNGPHCEVSWNGNHDDVLTVSVWWGGEHATTSAVCAPVVNAMSVVWDNAETALENVR